MSKCWYCNNELTTGDNPKHFGICNKCYDEMFKSGDTIIRSFTNKIADLEAKLAEKERQLNLSEELLIKQEKEYDEQLEKQAKIHYRHLKEKDQDKILFALEQLEKVKEFFLEEHRDEEMDTDYIITKDAGEIADYILDRIKQLKEGK